jgi:subtilase family serine protease
MRPTTRLLCAGVGAALLSLGTPLTQAQTQRVPSRIVSQVDDTRTVQLKGTVHPLARPEFDRGAVADSQPVSRMLLMLQRSPAQEAALEQLIDAQHSKGSGSYHAWLTPEQFGKQFGPSDQDLQAVTDWLTNQGFQIAKVGAGRTLIEFSGNAAQVRSAFHTELHKFAVNGETHIANSSDPSIPEALAPVVRGVASLNDFPRHSHSHNKGEYRMNRETGQIKPLYTFGDPAKYAIGPADFYKIYNVPASATGANVTIAIVSDSNINAQDVIDFRTLFNLPQNFTQANNVLVNGPDPGLTGDEGEADLDVQWAGAVAPQANILLVTTANTQSNPTQITSGTDLSAVYIVDNDPAVNGVPASILSYSFGECEPNLGASANTFYNSLWQQAAAEGITVTVSTGDSGAAACDPDPTAPITTAAVDGLAVNGIASTAYDTAVGGSDFEASAQPVTPPNTYWGATNTTVNGSPFGSALQYIPEITWDDSACAAAFPQGCTTVDPNGFDLAAAGGGPSNCGYWTGTNGHCQNGYPSSLAPYQSGVNNVFTTVRTIPDVSFFASNGENGVAVIVCESDANPEGASCSLSSPYTDFSLVGGTSISAPSFAGVVALLNQKTGTRTGNANYGLYALAASDTNYKSGNCNATQAGGPNSACVFNDITMGNNSVACVLGSTSNADGSTNWCNPGNGVNTSFGVTVLNGTNTQAYQAGAGYDAATGLGTINVGNLLTNWNNANRSATTTGITVPSPSGGTPSGTNFTATIGVTPSSATGNVALIALSSSDPTSVLAVIGGKTSNGVTSPFQLTSNSNGIISVQTNLLPPGTAYVAASYSGDATHAGSTSTPKALTSTVTGANNSTKVALSFVTFDSNGNPQLSTSKSVSYGSQYIMNAVVTNNGTNCGYAYPATAPPIPCPTGKIALTDNNQPLNDFPSGPNFNATNIAKLSNQGGLVEDSYVQLPGGSHSIQAQYTSGDANYQSGSSNTISVTITPAGTTMMVAGVANSSTSVTLTAFVGSSSNSNQGPTGTVQFTSNGSNLGSAVTCTPAAANSNNGASCTAQLTTTVAALYPPPTNDPRPTLPLLPMMFAALSLLLFAAGWRWIPQNRRRAYVYAGLLTFALMAVGIEGCGGGGGGGGGGTTLSIGASYAGDTNYGSSSGTTSVVLP